MRIRSIYTFLAMAFFCSTALGQDEWTLRKNKDGITVYTKPNENSNLDDYRVEATLEGSKASFYALFKDFDAYPLFFQDMKEIRVHLDEPDRHILYIRNKTPFPAKDRDGVFINRFSIDEADNTLHVDVECISDYYVKNKKLIQIPWCEGSWEVRELGNGQIHIIHEFQAHPGGSIPAFIVNIKTVQNPYRTIRDLKSLITMPKYQGRSFSLE